MYVFMTDLRDTANLSQRLKNDIYQLQVDIIFALLKYFVMAASFLRGDLLCCEGDLLCKGNLLCCEGDLLCCEGDLLFLFPLGSGGVCHTASD
jgi:hypothetical protein